MIARATQQDQFEGMYARLLESQTEWGEQQVSRADPLRTFAEELDLDAFDAAVADPAAQERVEEDLSDGRYLELTQLADPTDALDHATDR